MKVLKPGKIEIREFVCPNCGCVFVMDKNETTRSVRRTTGRTAVYVYFAKCPCREQIPWERGKPHEDLTQDVEQSVLQSPYELAQLVYECGVTDWRTSLNLSEFLLRNGVTL